MSHVDEVFSILYQDHSYYLKSPLLIKGKPIVQRRVKNYVKKLYVSWEEKDKAARKLQRFFRTIIRRKIYLRLKRKIFEYMHTDPFLCIKRIDAKSRPPFEKNNFNLVFRLAGDKFPPFIVYKVFPRHVVTSIKFTGVPVQVNEKLRKTTRDWSLPDGWKTYYVYRRDRFKIYLPSFNNSSHKFNTNTNRRNTNYIKWISQRYGCLT